MKKERAKEEKNRPYLSSSGPRPVERRRDEIQPDAASRTGAAQGINHAEGITVHHTGLPGTHFRGMEYTGWGTLGWSTLGGSTLGGQFFGGGGRGVEILTELHAVKYLQGSTIAFLSPRKLPQQYLVVGVFCSARRFPECWMRKYPLAVQCSGGRRTRYAMCIHFAIPGSSHLF